MSNGAQAATGATFRVLRELGSRAQRSFAAIREPQELVVLHRFVRVTGEAESIPEGAARVSAETMALLLRDARALAKHWHPNIVRVRHVDLAGNELSIATELVDGVTLADLVAATRTTSSDPALPFAVLVRILVDVLGGLHGLHGLRDGINAPLGAYHGEVCPSNIILGKDGVARVANVFRPRPVRIEPNSEATGYAAPEVLAGEVSQDGRADVYAVGVMLWESLTGRRLYDDREPARVAQRQREEELVAPSLPSTSPFAKLADVAMRALAFDPALRFRSASEMAAELRRVAGTRLAPGSAVAQKVVEVAGDRIRARRSELDPVTRKRSSDEPAPMPGDVAAPPSADAGSRTTFVGGAPKDRASKPPAVRPAIPRAAGTRPLFGKLLPKSEGMSSASTAPKPSPSASEPDVLAVAQQVRISSQSTIGERIGDRAASAVPKPPPPGKAKAKPNAEIEIDVDPDPSSAAMPAAVPSAPPPPPEVAPPSPRALEAAPIAPFASSESFAEGGAEKQHAPSPVPPPPVSQPSLAATTADATADTADADHARSTPGELSVAVAQTPERKRKMAPYILGGVGLAAALLIAIVASRGDDPKPAPAPTHAPVAAKTPPPKTAAAPLPTERAETETTSAAPSEATKEATKTAAAPTAQDDTPEIPSETTAAQPSSQETKPASTTGTTRLPPRPTKPKKRYDPSGI